MLQSLRAFFLFLPLGALSQSEAFTRSPWNMHKIDTQVLGAQVVRYLPSAQSMSTLFDSPGVMLGGFSWGNGTSGGGVTFHAPRMMTSPFGPLRG
jgi:hypothetical protein